MFTFFTKIFGSKYERDVKSFESVVVTANEFFEQYKSLSNDQLREKTNEFRRRISEYLKVIDDEIAALRTDADESIDFNIKEELYKELDEHIKDRDKALEEILLE